MNKALDRERTMETELKLALDPGDGAAFCRSPVLAGIPADEREQVSTYFDTPTGELRAAGLTLRVRRSGPCYVQTIKTNASAAAGIFARPEWEQEVDGPAPVLDAASPLRTIASDDVLSRLRPAFTVAVRRRRWQLSTNGAAIELVLDEGTITASGQDAPVVEIEAELKDGPPSALFALAQRLGHAAPLRLGVLSKAERGYRLADGRLDRPAKADRIRMDSTATVAAAFAVIAGSCLRQFRLNEDVLRLQPDASALHQARVALRRLRSALSLFKPILADDRFDHYSAGLRDLARALGPARDLDVMIGAAAAAGADAPEALTAARAPAYAAARAALDSQHTRDLMIELVAWITSGAWRTRPENQDAVHQPATQFAATAMGKLRRRLKKRGKHLADLDDDTRHRVRKLAKKGRYATEFFAPLFTEKKARSRRKVFRKRLATLQEHLGALNDLATAPSLMKRHGIDRGAIPLGDRDTLLAKAAKAHRRLIKAERFW